VGLIIIIIISYFLVVQVDAMGLAILTSVLLVSRFYLEIACFLGTHVD
jgi:hypothetical protein